MASRRAAAVGEQPAQPGQRDHAAPSVAVRRPLCISQRCGEALGDRRVVGGDDERGAGVLGGREQRVDDRRAVGAVELAGRLVGEDQPRLARRARGRRRRAAPGRRRSPRAACRRARRGRAARAPRAPASRASASARRRARAAARRSPRTVSGGSRLGPWKTTATGPGRSASRSPSAGQVTRARGRVVEAGQQVQQRRLARARRADERDARAGAHLAVGRLERRRSRVAPRP